MVPEHATAVMALAHGAGAGMRHVTMESLARVLGANGIATLRYQFPYMEDGLRRTDPPAVATKAVQAAVEAAAELVPGVPVFAGGKSFGARMSTTAASNGMLPTVRGLVCFGFPLHPAKQPGTARAEHLGGVPQPMLFLQGDRDALAELDLMKEVAAELPRATMKVVVGADHGFAVLKKSGRTNAEVLDELAAETKAFVALARG
jgi:predicted alpha/beta-hydrolase family hydrolase